MFVDLVKLFSFTPLHTIFYSPLHAGEKMYHLVKASAFATVTSSNFFNVFKNLIIFAKNAEKKMTLFYEIRFEEVGHFSAHF